MKTDALARRLRFAPPNPLVRRILLNDGDFLIFEAINRHGPLPVNFLHEFRKHLFKSYPSFQHRLTELYNGDDRGQYLTRPPQQFESFEARYQHVVYDLAPRARSALAERGTLSDYPPVQTSWFVHQLMQACVGASLELHAPAHGLIYRGRADVLSHPRCGTAKEAPKPLSIPVPGIGTQRTIALDDLGALENAAGKKRYLLIEIDRATESMSARDGRIEGNTYFDKKLDGYRDLFSANGVHPWFGFKSPFVLIVTTTQHRAAQIMRHVAKYPEEMQPRFLVKVDGTFGSNWRVPKGILTHLLDEPWQTTQGPRFLTQP